MSRHRNVRSMDYSEDYEGFDDVYGHSVDDDSCISPTDAQQWIYDRVRGQQSMSSFIAKHRDIKEEDEDLDSVHPKRRDSESFQPPILSDEDQARLASCIDEIRNVVGESISEKRLIQTILQYNFDCTKSLDVILNESSSSSSVNDDTSKFLKEPTEKGIPSILTDQIQKQPSILINAPKVNAEKHSLRKGFDLNSSSPNLSGRNTPEQSQSSVNQSTVDDGKLNLSKIKDSASITSLRNDKELYERERANEKQTIHLIVIGHVDAGKSTLLGHTLYDLGDVPQRVMHKYEQESKKLGKQSFVYAWVLDETGEERQRGITMDIGCNRFETTTKIVNLLDAPGHKDFIPNMISGAAQADVALLVVDATTGEFETGFEQGGQTREHALLVRSLGVSQLGVVVNKLDTVNWSQDRFNEIVAKLKTFLRQAGFKENDITYIPCSGLTGENLVKLSTESELASWYKGPTLINVIDHFRTPERAIDKPFRMSVNDIFKGTGTGFCISGRIETGVLCPNDKILVCPLKEQAIIKSITIDDITRTSSFAGDQVCVTLSSGIDLSSISIGSILCDVNQVIPIVTRIESRIVVFNVKVPITNGYPVLLHHQSLIEPATIIKLKAQLHKNGDVLKKRPRCLGNNSCAIIEIETTRPICIERYADFKQLGKIMLRVGGVTIAAGLVTKLIK